MGRRGLGRTEGLRLILNLQLLLRTIQQINKNTRNHLRMTLLGMAHESELCVCILVHEVHKSPHCEHYVAVVLANN